MKNKELIRTLKFTFWSISAGIIQVLLFTLLNELLNLNYWISYVPSLVASILWNFTINRKVTFKSTSNIKTSMLLVFLFYLVFTPVSTILGDLAEKNNINEYLILGVTMASNFILEYLYTRYIVYRNTCDTVVK
jgi:putative flippase GtrA